MEVRLISDWNKFLELKPDWDRLFGDNDYNSVFLSWDWCKCWLEHFMPKSGTDLFILVAMSSNNKNVVGIAPLIKTRASNLFGRSITIQFIGHDIAADYMDFLIDPESDDSHKIIASLVNESTKGNDWTKIDLMRFEGLKNTKDSIKSHLENQKFPYQISLDSISPQILLNLSKNEYLMSLSKGLRQDLRTSQNKLPSESILEMTSYSCFKDIYYLDKLVGFHKDRQKDKVGTSIFRDSKWKNFLNGLLNSKQTGLFSDLSVLKLDGKIISTVFGFRTKSRFLYWIPSFDTSYHGISIGKLHLHKLIDRTIDENIPLFDFMIGDEDYKRRWSNTSTENWRILIYREKKNYIKEELISRTKNKLIPLKQRSKTMNLIWLRLSKLIK